MERASLLVTKLPRDLPEPDVKVQLRRISWVINPGGDHTAEQVIEFLSERLTRMPGQGEDGVIGEGYVFFKQGQKADSIYFLSSGICELTTSPKRHGKSAYKRYIYPGNWFGERALLSGRGKRLGRSATVSSVTSCCVYFLFLKGVNELIAFAPNVQEQVALEQDVGKCRELLRHYRPYSVWTDAQLEELIRSPDNLWRADHEKTKQIPEGSCAILLQGKVVAEGHKTITCEPVDSIPEIYHGKTRITIAPYPEDEPAYLLLVQSDLKDEDLTMISKSLQTKY